MKMVICDEKSREWWPRGACRWRECGWAGWWYGWAGWWYGWAGASAAGGRKCGCLGEQWGGTISGVVVVREVSGDEWETLRDVRLAALREAPAAFGSTYAREAPFTEEQWRGRLNARAVTFFADLEDDAGPAGLASVFVEDGAAEVVSMWVRPSARGQGVGAALVDAAADWAKARGHDSLYLWVTESNTAARVLYERCGFTTTGERQPLPSDPSLREVQMLRALNTN